MSRICGILLIPPHMSRLRIPSAGCDQAFRARPRPVQPYTGDCALANWYCQENTTEFIADPVDKFYTWGCQSKTSGGAPPKIISRLPSGAVVNQCQPGGCLT